MFGVDDIVVRAVERAMDGVTLRQKVIADNLANAATPGFRARQVDFEDALSAALVRGTPQDAPLSVHDARSPVKQDGNSVDVTRETLASDRAAAQFEGLVAAFGFKVSSLRAALSR